MVARKPPMRRCVGCNASRPKESMIRIVRTPEKEVQIDEQGKAPGRGAYVCADAECIDNLLSGSRLSKALRISEINKETKDELFARLMHKAAK